AGRVARGKAGEGVGAGGGGVIEGAATERDELGRQLGEWQQPLRTAERGLALYRGLRRSLPVIGFGAGVVMEALAFVRPDGISGWVQNALELWRGAAPPQAAAARPPAPPPPRARPR